MSSVCLKNFAIAAMLLAGTSWASADPQPTQDSLPGVESGYSTVSPAPPEPEELSPLAEGNSFKVGDWDVTVSGSVSVGIGFGKRPEGGED